MSQSPTKFVDIAYLTSPFGIVTCSLWFSLTVAFSCVAAQGVGARHGHEFEFCFIVQVTGWVMVTLMMIIIMFSVKDVLSGHLGIRPRWHQVDFWINLFLSICLFIAACLASSSDELKFPFIGPGLKASCAFTWFSFFLSTAKWIMLLEQVDELPCPDWWPAKGLIIPSDAHNPKPEPEPTPNEESYQNRVIENENYIGDA
ncbi:Oidioi.mRNA.OKI2018_I69.chr2.g8023.t1.cds [Oikopleura dioica]|uniref:Oidioi.mRNA.OKI2018_I69.chr2.g8023.t1.cds n=1 Tax=Oikopleura dioica TaxID=34765 RepID=A0ABN7T7Y6_OIKDI|nr:Oidioi.mRNA.OKI2018_I69.chr2.g8023.t1.cds [Oikopleura dioica]